MNKQEFLNKYEDIKDDTKSALSELEYALDRLDGLLCEFDEAFDFDVDSYQIKKSEQPELYKITEELKSALDWWNLARHLPLHTIEG